MWFKNLHIYRFTQPFEVDAETLASQLESQVFVPCGGHDRERTGWVPPLGRHGSELVHATNGYLMLCSRHQEKLLPAAVIREAVDERAIEIEAREARPLHRKERRDLRDEVFFSLLPRALVRSTLQFAYIAPREQMLIIDTPSAKRAEEFLKLLRDTLGSLSVVPLEVQHSPIATMTRWVRDARAESGFSLGEECELRDDNDVSSLIRCKNQDLTASEISNHLKTGMHVSKLALDWQQRAQFVLDEDLVVRRLRFNDLLQEQAREIEGDDPASRFDVDFSLMTLEVSKLLEALTEALGGIDTGDEGA